MFLDIAGRDRVVVIGATVPLVLLDLRHGFTHMRATPMSTPSFGRRAGTSTKR
ncbi:MAG TPA: hypothetical protein VNI83_05820 [Vicinamibacterales bacterium]|nr:hypothetical protein [Vicinamibacterales bacterium]